MNIPNDIHEAADKLDVFFKLQGIKGWRMAQVAERELVEGLEKKLEEAWKIINVLNMHYIDDGECYPKALEWLLENNEYAS